MMNELCTFIIYFGKSFFQKVSPLTKNKKGIRIRNLHFPARFCEFCGFYSKAAVLFLHFIRLACSELFRMLYYQMVF